MKAGRWEVCETTLKCMLNTVSVYLKTVTLPGTRETNIAHAELRDFCIQKDNLRQMSDSNLNYLNIQNSVSCFCH